MRSSTKTAPTTKGRRASTAASAATNDNDDEDDNDNDDNNDDEDEEEETSCDEDEDQEDDPAGWLDDWADSSSTSDSGSQANGEVEDGKQRVQVIIIYLLSTHTLAACT
jgi:hypothetical protein